jgi:prepilin-type N-terminal cleavage/methylation domain-containing protein
MSAIDDDHGRGGFTLIELLVVVLVIALLTALAQPNLQRALLKARATAAVADLQVVRVAVLNYQGNNHAYPADEGRGVVPAGLDAYLPDNFSMQREYYTIDYDNWSAQEQGFVGLTIITTDALLGQEMVHILGPNTWSDGAQKFTWVIEWTK